MCAHTHSHAYTHAYIHTHIHNHSYTNTPLHTQRGQRARYGKKQGTYNEPRIARSSGECSNRTKQKDRGEFSRRMPSRKTACEQASNAWKKKSPGLRGCTTTG